MKDVIRILQVDDDEEDFMIIQDLLRDIRRQLYTIEWASGYEEALEKIGNDQYDIYLVDFRLGRYTGIELLRQIRSQDQHTPVIIFTGQGDEQVDMEAMRAGAADYLVKGRIDANILERSIRYSINQGLTQQKLLEHEKSLRDAEKFSLAGRMAQLIAHEIRNPLTNVKLATQQLQDEIPRASDSITTLFEMIDRNCNRINQLITNLLDSTKFADLTFEEVSINEVIDETIEMAKDRIDLKKIKVIREYADDICKVVGNQ